MPGPRILLYHRVAEADSDPWGLCVSPHHFAEHLEVLQHYGPGMQMRQLTPMIQDRKLPRRAVVVTFDDGYADNVTHAKPLLERYDYPATFFLTSGYLGSTQEFWWDELDRLLLQPGTLPAELRLTCPGRTYQRALGDAAVYGHEACRRYRAWRADEDEEDTPSVRHALYYDLWRLLYPLPHDEQQNVLAELQAWAGVTPEGRTTHRVLSADEVVALSQGDLIEIGSHSVTHPPLSLLSIPAQRGEIQQNKIDLEAILGHPVQSFSYPHGKYTQKTLSLVHGAGFTCACTNVGRLVQVYSDPFQLPRIYVGDWDGDEFTKRVLQ